MPQKHADRLALAEKLEVVQETAGFVPTCSVELTEALGIIAVNKKIGGAAKHLAEVARHQEKAGVRDNHSATRKIVHQYIVWGTDALKTTQAFESLVDATELVNPELQLEVAEIEPTTPGMLGLVRFHDLSVLRDGGGEQRLGYRVFGKDSIDWSTDNSAVMVFVEQRMSNWNVRDVTKLLPLADEDQRNRHEFFLRALEQVEEHFPRLRELAGQGVGQVLDVTPVQ